MTLVGEGTLRFSENNKGLIKELAWGSSSRKTVVFDKKHEAFWTLNIWTNIQALRHVFKKKEKQIEILDGTFLELSDF